RSFSEAGDLLGWEWRVLPQQLWVWWRQTRVLRLTLSHLTKGVEVKGSFDELREFERTLTSGANGLAGRITDASAFNAGEIRIYAPGRRPVKTKERKSGVPPLRWV